MFTVSYPHAITVENLDELLVFHRETFGGWRMEDAPPPAPQDPPPAPPNPPPAPQDPKPDDGKTFTQADVDRIIAGRFSKYADYDDLKKKLDDVEAAQATEAEKAAKQAREEGRQAALAEATPRLVRAEFRAAAAGRMEAAQLDALLEDLDLSKYLTKDGEVDTDRVAKKITALAPDPGPNRPPLGGGGRKTEKPPAGSLGEAIASRLASANR